MAFRRERQREQIEKQSLPQLDIERPRHQHDGKRQESVRGRKRTCGSLGGLESAQVARGAGFIPLQRGQRTKLREILKPNKARELKRRERRAPWILCQVERPC